MKDLKMKKNIFKQLRNNFIAGLVVILPIFLTVIIIRFLIVALNNIFLDPLIKIFRPYLTGQLLIFIARLGVFLILILFISMIGLATRIIIIHRLFRSLEVVFFKIPLISKVYSAMKDMSSAFFSSKEKFLKVVAVEYPRKGVYSIGFITSHENLFREKLGNKEVVNVYIPTTPNPTTGMLILVPKEDIIWLDIPVEEGLRLVISGGLVLPKNNKLQEGLI